ncbi:protein EFR3 homolog cmp44E-like [Diaphorina citri]|uniref:Protein EFR3 homolog cmp44E-like n=1 Tax=Diaphorina citri TaxID=121845 RepID=A0A3Q0IUS4_DIACI|nr:protein EFR3 homolog cmp44E-like [Diaphorina citri]
MVLVTEQMDVISEYPSKADTLFLRKYGVQLFRSIFTSLEYTNNTPENYKVTYKTLALICCELVSSENVSDFVTFTMNIQEMASVESKLSPAQRNQLHVMVVCLFSLVVHLLPFNELKQYVEKIVMNRKRAKAWDLLPEAAQDGDVTEEAPPGENTELYLNDKVMSEYFKCNKMEHGAMPGSFTCLEFQHRFTSEETDDSSDVDSEHNDRADIEHDLSFETTKRLLLEPSKEKRKQLESLRQQEITTKRLLLEPSKEKRKQLESLRQQEIAKKFRVSPFTVIMDEHTSSGLEPDSLTWIPNQVFEKQETMHPPPSATKQNPPIYETLFPELFAY